MIYSTSLTKLVNFYGLVHLGLDLDGQVWTHAPWGLFHETPFWFNCPTCIAMVGSRPGNSKYVHANTSPFYFKNWCMFFSSSADMFSLMKVCRDSSSEPMLTFCSLSRLSFPPSSNSGGGFPAWQTCFLHHLDRLCHLFGPLGSTWLHHGDRGDLMSTP